MSLLVLNKSRQTWQFYCFKSAFLSGCRRIFLNLSMSKIEKKKERKTVDKSIKGKLSTSLNCVL